MNEEPKAINFSMNARALCIPMTVSPPAIITRQPTGDISLQGPQGKFFLRVPAEDFPFLTPGASVLVALTIVKPEFGTPDAITNIPLN